MLTGVLTGVLKRIMSVIYESLRQLPARTKERLCVGRGWGGGGERGGLTWKLAGS